ncbi:unnamed protein product [Clonostachys rosea]|uniref:Uncharacterized protein n=1 Tax=Bionectria ochroleuca TaxID=29856 RepID=A0ABY6U278_BIOOC|nr:unnamed protein product [Clonostachys rosea]
MIAKVAPSPISSWGGGPALGVVSAELTTACRVGAGEHASSGVDVVASLVLATPVEKSTSTTLDEFLAKHPEIVVGREKLENLRDEIDIATNYKTFEAATKPFANAVLVQKFHGDTNERLLAVILIDDAQAEKFYWEKTTGRKCDLCFVQIEKQDPEELLLPVFKHYDIKPDHECKSLPVEEE